MNKEPLLIAGDDVDNFCALHERFAFALRAYGIKDGPALDHALSDAVRAAWQHLKRDDEAREAARAHLSLVK